MSSRNYRAEGTEREKESFQSVAERIRDERIAEAKSKGRLRGIKRACN